MFLEAMQDCVLHKWNLIGRVVGYRYDSRGEEGADKCSWKYGETWSASNGAMANIRLNGKGYMIQQNWAIGKGCSMGW